MYDCQNKNCPYHNIKALNNCKCQTCYSGLRQLNCSDSKIERGITMCYDQNAVQAMQKRDIVKECLDFENRAYTELKNISDKRRKPVGKTFASDEPRATQ